MNNEKKSIVFDTGPIITFTLNELLWLLDDLQKKFGGDFLITEGVKHELITRPLRSKKYMFEAIRVNDQINEGVLKLLSDNEILPKARQLTDLANNCFKAEGKYIELVHQAEMETVAAGLHLNSTAIVIDERTSRMLIEEPYELAKMMEEKLHTKIEINENVLRKFKIETKGMKIIRSVELVIVAYEMGLLDRYVTSKGKIDNKMKKLLLESVLWALKLNGCAISKKNIDAILRLEK
ncbi:hypothetical protein KY325_03325 [Candidatus Woesearchaeota archaeon]|nr:hypothetical protein [Candidatus Woesearchaeota archaeon]MBW3018164.1 hypothetical protein [Candidatus Woesearchaeota archaeon]